MNNKISIEELEQKVMDGEDIIDSYFDASTTRIGPPRPMTSRRKKTDVTVPLEIPKSILAELDDMAHDLNISRQAVVTMMLRRSLDDYYLARLHSTR